MQLVALLVAAALALASGASGAAVVLDEKNFATSVKEGTWLVKFYAPWCGHCKALAPTWEALPGALGADSGVKVGKVDCTQNEDLCGAFGVRGYPTLKAIRGADVFAYKGERTEAALKAFATSDMADAEKSALPKLGAKAKPLSTDDKGKDVIEVTADSLEDVISGASAGGQTWMVEFYAPWCGHCKRLTPAYSEAATTLVADGVKVGRVDGSQFPFVARRFGVRGFPTIVVLKDGKVYQHEGGRTANDLVEFARAGYRDTQSGPIPPPVGMFDVNQKDVDAALGIIRSTIKSNVWLFMGGAFATGILFGALLCGVAGSAPSRRAPAPAAAEKKTN